MLNLNVEVKNGIGTIVESDGNKQYVTNIPMQLVLIDGVRVAYKRVDVDNFGGGVSFTRAYPIAEIHDETTNTELVAFKATSEQEFYIAVDKLVEKRFQNKRKEFIEKTVRRYSESQMLIAMDRCLLNFDNERYQFENEQYNQETKEFFESLFEN